MNKLKSIAFSIASVSMIGSSLLAPLALAECANATDCAQQGMNSANNGGTTKSVGDIIAVIANILIVIVAAVSVIMIIVGGIKYTLTQGDQNAVTTAKHTVLYAVIGLIVAIVAYAIVNFVITTFTGGGSSSFTDSKKPDLKT